MYYSILVGAAMAASVLATPPRQQSSPVASIEDKTPFHLKGILPGTDIHSALFTSTGHNLFVNYPEDLMDDTCESPTIPGVYTATFFLDNGTLNLYTPPDISHQFYLEDTLGMLVGVTLPYQENIMPPPEGFVLHGWELAPAAGGSELELKFKGHDFIGCAEFANDTDWDYAPRLAMINMGADSPNLGAMEKCQVFSAYVSKVADNPNACTYCWEGDCCKICDELAPEFSLGQF